MASPDPQIVLKLAADIVAAKEYLEKLQAQWDSFFISSAPLASVATGTSNTPQPMPRTRAAGPDTLTARIISFLDSDPQCHYETEEIAKFLGEPQEKVQRTINKLVFRKKIGRYSRGLYESIIQV